MAKRTLSLLQKMKQNGEKITMLTAYDASFAQLMSLQGVDVLLVGDTLGMVVMGHDSTVPVSINDIAHHLRAVVRGNQGSFIIGDMPFMAYTDAALAIKNSRKLLQAGAHMIKMEGGRWLVDTVRALSERGVAVCCHIGLTPQSVHAMGGYKVQGRDVAGAEVLIEDAKLLQQAGAGMLVLECVPHSLASDIAGQLDIPVIGIGAGPSCDGQVLVTYDMLGLTSNPPKTFTRNFMTGCSGGISEAIANYIAAVKDGSYPSLDESFQ